MRTVPFIYQICDSEQNENAPRSPAQEDETFKIDANVIGNVFALCLTVSAGAWANVIPPNAIPFISQRFPEGAGQAAWIATAPNVVSAVVQCMVGDLSGILGRRGLLMVGCVAGVAGMLLGGLAADITMLIGGQVLNGLSIACMFVSSPLLQEIVPKKHRPVAVACVFIQNHIGGEREGWRLGFYIGAAYWAVTGVILLLLYHPMPRPDLDNLSVMTRLKRLDWPGVVLVCAGIPLFLVGLNYGDNPYPWKSAHVLGCLISGVVLCIGFVIWEWKGSPNGLVPHRLFGNRNYSLALYVRVVGGIALLGSQSYLPQVAVNVFGTGGLTTAVWQVPLSISSVIGAILAAVLIRLVPQVRWLLLVLVSTLILGAGLMLIVKPGVNFAAWFFPSVIMGTPVGAEAALLTVLTGYFVPDDLIATGVCMANAVTLLGGAVAVIIYSTVLNSKIKTALPAGVSSAALKAGLPRGSLEAFIAAFLAGDADRLAAVPGATPAVITAAGDGAKTAWAESYHYIWYILIAFAAICCVLVLFFTSTKEYLTDEVTAPVQRRREKKGAEGNEIEK